VLKTPGEVTDMINSGKWLHISGNADLLKKLPGGNWMGGSTEYFMSEDGGAITDEKLEGRFLLQLYFELFVRRA